MIYDAGNPIVDFGSYGNFDSQYILAGVKDKKPLVATPLIPLPNSGTGLLESVQDLGQFDQPALVLE